MPLCHKPQRQVLSHQGPYIRALILERVYFMGGSRGGTGGLDPPVKSQVAKGFLRNTGSDPPRGVICKLIFAFQMTTTFFKQIFFYFSAC